MTLHNMDYNFVTTLSVEMTVFSGITLPVAIGMTFYLVCRNDLASIYMNDLASSDRNELDLVCRIFLTTNIYKNNLNVN